MPRRPARQPRIQYDGRRLVRVHGPHHPERIILHDTESHDEAGTKDLEGVARFWCAQGKGYGAHVGVDAEGNSARYVDDEMIAWHCGGRNTASLGLEMIGFARLTRRDWFKRPAQLHKTARWLAYWSKHWGIPLRIDTNLGVSTHAQQSAVFGTTSHTDPGEGFPLRMVVWLARRYRRLGW